MRHDTLDPGQRCAMDQRSYHMIDECGKINENCSMCGFNPIVHERRVQKIRSMNREELARFMIDWSNGLAWEGEA